MESARQAQFCEWVARERPDVVCLQELKAEPTQILEQCKVVDYDTFCMACAPTPASRCISAKAFETPPAFSHPAFDMESRIVQAQLGKLLINFDLRAERQQGLRRRSISSGGSSPGCASSTTRVASSSCAAT